MYVGAPDDDDDDDSSNAPVAIAETTFINAEAFQVNVYQMMKRVGRTLSLYSTPFYTGRSGFCVDML